MHPNAEAFIFLGTDPDKPSNLCGKVEFWIGEGEEAEKYTITTSTYIFVPPNVVHSPIWVKRSIGLSSCASTATALKQALRQGLTHFN